SSILRSVGNTRMSLIFLVISIFLNVILDLLLIKQFSMGIMGAALATVISQAVSALLCYFYIHLRSPIPEKSPFKTFISQIIQIIHTG
ncbi:MAG: MATE family efflux transporter, partial [Coprococcus catus]|nr:MATE family efflux transporter [Coprococcus catus]